ncbi:2-oxo-4-hydroxy-4-carboxy-5-ureidoimidazoline decarboxylase [Streptomyces sp. AS58]|uniref:2-oxo-4-hydroxy-4-carboxy-5-ureidoimidazoline decarboxylase n=1 Tax=Streptomyces sp. AS58 TaxID=1519489 RepID=UPI00099D37FE
MTTLDNVTTHPTQHPLSTHTQSPRGPPLPAHRLPDLPGHLAIPEQSRGGPAALDLFNTAPAEAVQPVLLACLHSRPWSRRLTAHRPYPDLDALLAAADEAAYDLTPVELAEALAGESLPELPEDAYLAAHTALSAAQAAYEARFGHVFVICVDDLTPDEVLDRVLAAIRSRLANDPEEERIVAAEELRRLARGRLIRALRGTTP